MYGTVITFFAYLQLQKTSPASTPVLPASLRSFKAAALFAVTESGPFARVPNTAMLYAAVTTARNLPFAQQILSKPYAVILEHNTVSDLRCV